MITGYERLEAAEYVALLLRYGGDMEIRDRDGTSAADMAQNRGKLKILKNLSHETEAESG